jgi:uncharacterized membrane protein YgdD (TMEM256/DUF423 family)
MNANKTLLAGAIFGMIGVALGAFGAHALKSMLTEYGRLDTYELAVRYEVYHALVLLLVGIIQQTSDSRYIRLSALLFVLGIIGFSGSLYMFCFTQSKVFAFVTPVGGVLLLSAWLFLAYGFLRLGNLKKP